jgi:hypothetical protein
MPHLTAAPSTQALLRLVDGPAMLSKHVRIGQYIVDAVILDAHPEVAGWYGYTSPAALQGRYVSYLHDPRDLAQVRLYAVARQLGIPGVPEEYDIRINLPNGSQRWLRKQQVRQVTDGEDVYWVSYSIPIAAAQARPMPEVAVPLSAAALEGYLGRCTVAEAERLIASVVKSNIIVEKDTSFSDIIPSRDTSIDFLPMLSGASSIELPLGSATYRRWVHHCNRCHRFWVAERAAPKKCVHCNSPYWNTPRRRNRAARRTRYAKSDDERTRSPD